jgi:hypothetical protein
MNHAITTGYKLKIEAFYLVWNPWSIEIIPGIDNISMSGIS